MQRKTVISTMTLNRIKEVLKAKRIQIPGLEIPNRVRIPRTTIVQLSKQLAKSGRCLVLLTKTGSVRVYDASDHKLHQRDPRKGPKQTEGGNNA